MKTGAGIRCDGCSRIEDKNPLSRDGRPVDDSRDRFFDFVVPPNREDVNPITGKVKQGKFRGIASETNPMALAPLHACPGCAPAIRKGMKAKDPAMLPHGPLRQLMEQVKAKYGLRALRIH